MKREIDPSQDALIVDQPREHADVLEGIARGEEAIDGGHTLTHAQAETRLARWLKPRN